MKMKIRLIFCRNVSPLRDTRGLTSIQDCFSTDSFFFFNKKTQQNHLTSLYCTTMFSLHLCHYTNIDSNSPVVSFLQQMFNENLQEMKMCTISGSLTDFALRNVPLWQF